MTISNASPVQFWSPGDETFNEKDICSITQVCFCQPWQCDDTIKLQVSDNNNFDYLLDVYDSNGVFKSQLYFTYFGGVWHLSFVPDGSSPGICAGQYFFKIIQRESFANGLFDAGVLSPWVGVADGGVSVWAWGTSSNDGSAVMSVNFAAVGGTSRTTQALRHTYHQISRAQAKRFTYKVVAGIRTNSVGTWNNSDFYAVYYSNGVEVASQLIVTFGDNSTNLGSFAPSTYEWDTVGFRIVFKYNTSGGVFSGAWTVNITQFYPSDPTDIASTVLTLNSQIVALSDCLDIQQEQECTTLLEYSNSDDFAGLIYPDSSPAVDFFLRIPAIFFDESFPDEYEAIDLKIID